MSEPTSMKQAATDLLVTVNDALREGGRLAEAGGEAAAEYAPRFVDMAVGYTLAWNIPLTLFGVLLAACAVAVFKVAQRAIGKVDDPVEVPFLRGMAVFVLALALTVATLCLLHGVFGILSALMAPDIVAIKVLGETL